MNKIRVLLASYPMMIPDAIRQLVAEQEDMDLVGDCRGPMRVLQETGRTKANAVILAQERTEELGLCSQLLAVYPDLTIVCVATDMAAAFTQQLCSYRRNMVVSNKADIVDGLRAAVRKPCDGQTFEVERR